MNQIKHDENVDVEGSAHGPEFQDICGAVGGSLRQSDRCQGILGHQQGEPAEYEQYHSTT
ncbi:hypothetical protein DPMN_087897 [Dreissena polymorpha]|uniref:Uncharacterized protein n=1 Tax=Dreissena polymorpha TaxID=45954 RepID=A0A9D4KT53_DREPO|nr:hypothetical protein DPMN_087897 [Dreissena polymorpha]